MSSIIAFPCRAFSHEVQADVGRLHDKADLEAARQYLIERLHEGKTVRGLTLRELLHAELEGMHARAELSTREVVDVLLADAGERAAKADTFVAGVIERFLETNEALVAETAADLAFEAPDA